MWTCYLNILVEMSSILQSRDEEIERLEGEINGYRDDIDNMFESFRQREQDLRQEMQGLEAKNQVLTHSLTQTLSFRSLLPIMCKYFM